MARAVAWSLEAVEDVEAIAAYIQRDSPWYAKAVVSKIVETVETIPDFPELGRAVPELGDAAIRERFVHRYRVIYRLDAGQILIVAVIHGRQDFAPMSDHIAGG